MDEDFDSNLDRDHSLSDPSERDFDSNLDRVHSLSDSSQVQNSLAVQWAPVIVLVKSHCLSF
jgi:hypothetical protein